MDFKRKNNNMKIYKALNGVYYDKAIIITAENEEEAKSKLQMHYDSKSFLHLKPEVRELKMESGVYVEK